MLAHVSLFFFEMNHFWIRLVWIWKHKLAIRCFHWLSHCCPDFRVHHYLVSWTRKGMVEVTIKVFSEMFTCPLLATSRLCRHLHGSSLASRPFHGHWLYIFSQQMRWKNNLHRFFNMLCHWCCRTPIPRTTDLEHLYDTLW